MCESLGLTALLALDRIYPSSDPTDSEPSTALLNAGS
jgi:hypothetical protein